MFHVEKNENSRLILVSDCDKSVTELLYDVEKELWKHHGLDLKVYEDQLAVLIAIGSSAFAAMTSYTGFVEATSIVLSQAVKPVLNPCQDVDEDTIGEYLRPCYAAFKTFLMGRGLCFKDWNRQAFVGIVEKELFNDLQQRVYAQDENRTLVAFPSIVDPKRVLVILDGSVHRLIYEEGQYENLISRVKDSDLLVVSIFRETVNDKQRFSITSAIFDCNKAELV